MDERTLLQQFLAEADDIVDALERDVEQLVAAVRTGRPNPELLNRVFRSAHSLKGMAGMAGIGPVQLGAHAFEDLLEDMRMGRVRVDDRVVAGCARAAGMLGVLIGAVARGASPDAEADDLATAVAELRRTAIEASGVAILRDEIDLDDSVRRTLTEYEEHRLLENLRERRPILDVRVAFELAGFDTGFRGVCGRLGETGEVISKLPGTAGDDPMRIAFRMLVATDESVDVVRSIVEEFDGSAQCISRYETVQSGIEPDVAVEPAAASVRVPIRALDDLAVLAESLAHQAASMSTACDSMAGRLGLGARELFDLRQHARRTERGFAELEERLVELRLVPLSQTFARAERQVAMLAGDLGREAEVVIEGDAVRLDKAIVDRIADPLAHLLTNAVDHGIEPPEDRVAAGKPRAGRIRLSAEPRGNRVALTISDDGRGIDPEALARAAIGRGIAFTGVYTIFQPGFSTAAEVSRVSGRGVGLDAVAAAVSALGGEVHVESAVGSGTTFTLTVPTTLVMVSAFFVEAGAELYAVDVNQLFELAMAEPGDVLASERGPAVRFRDEVLPLYRLARLVCPDAPDGNRTGRQPILIARCGDERAAIAVDRLVGEREVVVKSLGRHAGLLRGVGGAVEVGDARVALLLDLGVLVGERGLATGDRSPA